MLTTRGDGAEEVTEGREGEGSHNPENLDLVRGMQRKNPADSVAGRRKFAGRRRFHIDSTVRCEGTSRLIIIIIIMIMINDF